MSAICNRCAHISSRPPDQAIKERANPQRESRRRIDPRHLAEHYIGKNEDPPGFEVKIFPGKGRGVVTTCTRRRGDFLLQYTGEMISSDEGERREKKRSSGYRFFYKKLCVDATQETGRLGRLVNHDRGKERNAVIKEICGSLVLFCVRDIEIGEELTYDYGLKELPWEKEYLETRMMGLTSIVLSLPSISNWQDLAEVTLARVLCFNKRRSNEAARVLVDQYQTRPRWIDENSELVQSLQPIEKNLMKIMDLVEVLGKNGKRVPMLLTKTMVAAIDALVIKRTEAGMASCNPYVFAQGDFNHMKGSECFRKTTRAAQLQYPERITTTKLRKYLATVSQLFKLSSTELEELARHMGHELSVHRRFYRLQEDVIELAKVSKLLIAVEEGKAHNFSGCSLDDINVADIEIEDDKESRDTIQEIDDVLETDDDDSDILDVNNEINTDTVDEHYTTQEKVRDKHTVNDVMETDAVENYDYTLDRGHDKRKDKSYIRAYESLKKTCDECSLVAPSRITSVSMRKYTATLSQMLNLESYQLEWLCRHLGHSTDVHKSYYRHMSGYIERVHLSKIFLLQDLNLTSKFKGKSLDDIDIADIIFPGDKDIPSDKDNGNGSLTETVEDQEPDENMSGPMDFDDVVFEENESDQDNDSVSEEEEDMVVKKRKTAKKAKAPCKRQSFDSIEMNEIQTYFKSYLDCRICPRTKAVEVAKKQSKHKKGKIWMRPTHKIVKKISAMNHKQQT